MTNPEGYNPSEKEMKQAEDMMTPEENLASSNRKLYYDELKEAAEKEADLTVEYDHPDSGGNVLSGTIKGREIEITRYENGAHVGTLAGENLPSEEGKRLYEKYAPTAVNKELEKKAKESRQKPWHDL